MQTSSTADIHKALRKARIAAGLTQVALAEAVGCKQSAVSMLEAGKTSAISKETLKKIAETLGVALPEENSENRVPSFTASGEAFCPNFQCLSNMPYLVGDDVFFLPLGAAGEGAHCILCGEILERVCPSCGASIRKRGSCCDACGATLINAPEGFIENLPKWVESRQATTQAVLSAIGAGR